MEKHQQTSATDIAAVEKEIEAVLASHHAAEKSTAAAAAAAETDADKLERIFGDLAEIKKGLAAVQAGATAGPGDDDDDDDEEVGASAAKSTFLRSSLEDLGAGGRDPKQTAMDVSNWLSGLGEVVKGMRTELTSAIKGFAATQAEQGRQIGLLLQLAAISAKKSVDTAAAHAAAPTGRSSQLTVIPGNAGSAIDTSQIPGPQELKQLAIKAMTAGKITPHQVGLVESYINGSGPVGEDFGAGPQLPPKPLLDVVLSMRTAA